MSGEPRSTFLSWWSLQNSNTFANFLRKFFLFESTNNNRSYSRFNRISLPTGQTLSQIDGNSTGGDSGNVRSQSHQDSGNFVVATRQRRLGTVTQPQGLIRPDTPPPTRSLLLDFAASEQESNDQQPLTRSPPGYSSSVSVFHDFFFFS